jgi:hypothetical protein
LPFLALSQQVYRDDDKILKDEQLTVTLTYHFWQECEGHQFLS